jgi:hypothetical protein
MYQRIALFSLFTFAVVASPACIDEVDDLDDPLLLEEALDPLTIDEYEYEYEHDETIVIYECDPADEDCVPSEFESSSRLEEELEVGSPLQAGPLPCPQPPSCGWWNNTFTYCHSGYGGWGLVYRRHCTDACGNSWWEQMCH